MYTITYFCLDCNNKFGVLKYATWCPHCCSKNIKKEIDLIKKNSKKIKKVKEMN